MPLLFIILLFSGVVLVNINYSAGITLGKHPKDALLPILAGMFLLFGITMLLIASNVWGYLPLGTWMRNRFYLPFLLAGIGMMLPWIFYKTSHSTGLYCGAGFLKVLVLLLALLAVGGELTRCPWSTERKEESNLLTVLTYNMQQGSHDKGNRNYMAQCELLRNINADIVGLQESDTPRPSGGNVDAVRYFAESLDYAYVYYGPNTVAGTFGTAILSRYPIKHTKTLFSYSDTDEIGTSCCEIDVCGKTIAFFCCHPAGSFDAKDSFVTALLAALEKYRLSIAVGDFNFRPQSSHYERLASKLCNSAAQLGEEKINFHNGNPSLDRKIDHIFFSENFRTLESHYLPPPTSETDHPAHWAVIKLP